MDNSRIFLAAIEQGSIDNLKWLEDNGCPIDYSATMEAARVHRSSPEILDWLKTLK